MSSSSSKISIALAATALLVSVLFATPLGQAASNLVLAKNSVGSKQVINGSLQQADLSKKARKALKGSTGPRGFTGAQGAQGAKGPSGQPGPEGPFPAGDLPSGKTMRGAYTLGWSAAAPSGLAVDGYSFGFRLASAPIAHYIAQGTPPPAQCPGSASEPEAQAGHLCVYEAKKTNVSSFAIGNPITNGPGASRYGFFIQTQATAAGFFYSNGTWAVTSP
jgi:hypothetical protein